MEPLTDRDARSTKGGHRLFDHSLFPDAVILRCRGHNFFISSSYLALHSPFFHDFFYGSIDRNGKFELDCDPHIFGDLLDMIYPCYKKTDCCKDCSSSLADRLNLALQLKLRLAVRRLVMDNMKREADDLKKILQENNAWASYSNLFVNFHKSAGPVNPKRDYSDSQDPLSVTMAFPDAATVVVEGATLIVSASTLSLHSPLLAKQLLKNGQVVQGTKIGLKIASFNVFLQATLGVYPELLCTFLNDLKYLGAKNLYDFTLWEMNGKMIRGESPSYTTELLEHYSAAPIKNWNRMKSAASYLTKEELETFVSRCTSLNSSDKQSLSSCAIPKNPITLEILNHAFRKDSGSAKSDMIRCIKGWFTTVLELKHLCEEAFRVPVNQQTLRFDGVRMQDEMTLEYYQVEPDDALELFVSITGC